jgi:PKHD-type hydroxylase
MSGSLHRVNPDSRCACQLRSSDADWWRTNPHRETLYRLDQTIQKVRGKHGETDETVALAGHYHNLLRMWSRSREPPEAGV